MGVGKTATVIGAANRIGARRGIVVAPAMVREHWLGEFRKFSTIPYRVCKARNNHDYVAWKKGIFDILVTSYEMAVKWAPDILKTPAFLDFVVFDEAHYLKGAGAARTKKLLGADYTGNEGISALSKHVWHVTGTPMSNDPLDIFTFLQLMHAVDMTQNGFIRAFFHEKRGMYNIRTSARAEMIEPLKQLIQNNSIRRLKVDVNINLPPIFLTTALVDGDTQAIHDMLKEYPGLERSIVHALEMGGLSFLDAQHIATLRRLVGEAKAIPYASVLLEEIRAGITDKRVVYGVHRDALTKTWHYLTTHGVKAVLITGDTPEAARMEAVRAFQNDADCRVFLGNIRAAGTGITLHAACEIDMLESDWSPGGNAQAIMRVHRLGQTRNVRARFITLSNSIDEVVNTVVAQKTAAIAQIEGTPMQSAPLDELLKYLH